MQKLKAVFYQQKRNARRRGIEFHLTFDEWLSIWEESGHLAERGIRKGQYQMARIGDCGAYCVGNVSIMTSDSNKKDYQWSPERRAKMSAMMKGNQRTLGYKALSETRAKLSVAHKGRKFSPEHRANLSAAQKGRIVSEETREKIREALTGRTDSDEVRAKKSAAMMGNQRALGRKASDETRAKMSEAHKGRVIPDEVRAKMSESQKKRYAAYYHRDLT